MSAKIILILSMILIKFSYASLKKKNILLKHYNRNSYNDLVQMTYQNKNQDLNCLKIRGGRSRTRKVSRHKSRNGDNDNTVFNFACINIGMYFILYQCMK